MDVFNPAAKFLGAMIGGGIGDAIGELAFQLPDRNRLEAEIGYRPVLQYTDDTAMTIALSESLCAVGEVDAHHLGETFRSHYQREPWRGYGPGPPKIFRMVARGECDYPEAARQLYNGLGSQGNGAAMRVTPLGLYYFDSPLLYDSARLAAEVTHAHPVGIDGAAVQAKAIAQAVTLSPGTPFSTEGFIEPLIAWARTAPLQEKLERVRALLTTDLPSQEVATELGHSVRVHESLPFALYCFLRHPRSFEQCLWCAILGGGDRDTMGAMAGAVSGAYLGVEDIPTQWRDKLENLSLIETLTWKLLSRRNHGRGKRRRQ